MDNDLVQLLRSVIREESGPVNERLDRMETEQTLIKQAVLDTNERVKRIEEVQESQHKIIELLSVRSIDQKAQLKRIK
ncbi:hypothetical protein [Paenibacillus donghaensis]|uniref:Uncharacterized protein n=1 Tax=Paenibacillus donghaensis TaxID=414771 RepID=A0A2Z2KJZ2_9BACL|nr:hypothetical protein [Paenibacillus donghaensis]ASA21272.1 hypothetical protein B9T62_11040 [Paenibacillus donghaensis]